MKKILLATGVIALIYGNKIYQLFKQSKFSYLDFKFLNERLDNPIVLLTFSINNPTNTNVNLNDLKGEVFNAETFIGTYQLLEPLKITANSNTAIPMQVTFKTFDVLRQLLWASDLKKYELRFKGSIKIDWLRLPYNYNYEYVN